MPHDEEVVQEIETSEGEEGELPEGTAEIWVEIPQIPSEATGEELEAIERLPLTENCDARDDAFFDSLAFPQLEDRAYQYMPTSKIEFLMTKVTGKKRSQHAYPKIEFVSHSATVEYGGLSWRLAVYPFGNNDSDTIAAFLECMTITDSVEATTAERTGEKVFPLVESRMFEPQARVPVRLSIVVFNPAEPRVNYHKESGHPFMVVNPDHGFDCLCDVPITQIGKRQLHKRRPLLENDQLGFICRFRIILDPTNFYLEPSSCRDWHFEGSRTGFKPLYGDPKRVAHAANFITALTILCALPPFRRIVYLAWNHERRAEKKTRRPLVNALVALLMRMSRITGTVEPISEPASVAEVVDCIEDIYVKDVKKFRSFDTPTYAPWQNIIKTLDDLDVYQAQSLILEGLKNELKDSPFHETLLDFFNPSCLRVEEGTVQMGSTSSGLQQDSYPKMLQFEHKRQHFNQHARRWKKDNKEVPLSRSIILEENIEQQPTRFSLFALVLHEDSNLQSRIFRPMFKSGDFWLNISTNKRQYNRVTRITLNEVFNIACKSVYLSLYVRDDILEAHILQSSRSFIGLPERDFRLPTATLRERSSSEELGLEVVEEENDEDENAAEDDEHEEESRESGVGGPATESTIAPDIIELEIEFLGWGWFRGPTKFGVPHGWGERIFPNGDRYVGNFVDGCREGHGKQDFYNEDEYTGTWRKDLMHGEGKMISAATGNTYVGQYEAGRQHGKFTLTGDYAETMVSCLVCLDNERDRVFDPCGHVCVCSECLTRIRGCPVCRAKVLKAIPFHLV